MRTVRICNERGTRGRFRPPAFDLTVPRGPGTAPLRPAPRHCGRRPGGGTRTALRTYPPRRSTRAAARLPRRADLQQRPQILPRVRTGIRGDLLARATAYDLSTRAATFRP